MDAGAKKRWYCEEMLMCVVHRSRYQQHRCVKAINKIWFFCTDTVYWDVLTRRANSGTINSVICKQKWSCSIYIHIYILPLRYTFVCFLMWILSFLDPENGNEKATLVVVALDSIYAMRAYAIAIPSVCLTVHSRVIHAKLVEVRILQFSLYGSPIPLVFPR